MIKYEKQQQSCEQMAGHISMEESRVTMTDMVNRKHCQIPWLALILPQESRYVDILKHLKINTWLIDFNWTLLGQVTCILIVYDTKLLVIHFWVHSCTTTRSIHLQNFFIFSNWNLMLKTSFLLSTRHHGKRHSLYFLSQRNLNSKTGASHLKLIQLIISRFSLACLPCSCPQNTGK